MNPKPGPIQLSLNSWSWRVVIVMASLDGFVPIYPYLRIPATAGILPAARRAILQSPASFDFTANVDQSVIPECIELFLAALDLHLQGFSDQFVRWASFLWGNDQESHWDWDAYQICFSCWGGEFSNGAQLRFDLGEEASSIWPLYDRFCRQKLKEANRLFPKDGSCVSDWDRSIVNATNEFSFDELAPTDTCSLPVIFGVSRYLFQEFWAELVSVISEQGQTRIQGPIERWMKENTFYPASRTLPLAAELTPFLTRDWARVL